MRNDRAGQAHRRPGHTTLRLLLALLLAIAPPLSAAQPLQMDAPAADAAERGHPSHAAMPCHGHTDDGRRADDACPHCDGAAPATACQCGGHIAPAGLATPALTAADVPAGQEPAFPMASDALPASPGGRLFRPPI